jgi:uncharacterized protein (DUF1810 family)
MVLLGQGRGDGEAVMADPYHLQRFVDAQEPVYETVRAELRAGRKRTHWMWFIFPQFRDLGNSEMARRYAIGSREEAVAYLAHPVLAPRLRECTRFVIAARGQPIRQILGSPDDMKFRSSMTLFARCTQDNRDFTEALAAFYGGAEDPRTVALLEP